MSIIRVDGLPCNYLTCSCLSTYLISHVLTIDLLANVSVFVKLIETLFCNFKAIYLLSLLFPIFVWCQVLVLEACVHLLFNHVVDKVNEISSIQLHSTLLEFL